MLDPLPVCIELQDNQTLIELHAPFAGSLLGDHFLESSLQDLANRHLETMTKSELDGDWRLNDFFGMISVINLAEEDLRLKRITKELQDVGTTEFEVFSAINGRKAIDPSIWKKFKSNRAKFDLTTKEGLLAQENLQKGEAGCYMSHYLLIKQVKESFDVATRRLQRALLSFDQEEIYLAKIELRKFSSVLILEDDTGFGIVDEDKTARSKKNVGVILREALSHLPEEWDMLYFMCAPHERTKKKSSHLRQLSRSVFLNAYAVNYTMYDPIIKLLEKVNFPEVEKISPVDNTIGKIHKKHRVFAINPSIAFQFNGKSSIDSTISETLTQHQPVLTRSDK